MLTASIVPSTSPKADTFAQCIDGFAEEGGHTPVLMMSATGHELPVAVSAEFHQSGRSRRREIAPIEAFPWDRTAGS
jgi:hypothetical protein